MGERDSEIAIIIEDEELLVYSYSEINKIASCLREYYSTQNILLDMYMY